VLNQPERRVTRALCRARMRSHYVGFSEQESSEVAIFSANRPDCPYHSRPWSCSSTARLFHLPSGCYCWSCVPRCSVNRIKLGYMALVPLFQIKCMGLIGVEVKDGAMLVRLVRASGSGRRCPGSPGPVVGLRLIEKGSSEWPNSRVCGLWYLQDESRKHLLPG